MIELQNQLASVVSSVWSTIFGTEAMPAEPGPSSGTPDELVAIVRITGEQGCVVTISCPASAARIIAGGMLDLPDDSMTDDDVRDALGEFANMAAGNLKALLPSGHHLSLPGVVSAARAAAIVSPEEVRDRCALQCGDEVVIASVYHADELAPVTPL